MSKIMAPCLAPCAIASAMSASIRPFRCVLDDRSTSRFANGQFAKASPGMRGPVGSPDPVAPLSSSLLSGLLLGCPAGGSLITLMTSCLSCSIQAMTWPQPFESNHSVAVFLFPVCFGAPRWSSVACEGNMGPSSPPSRLPNPP